jgi:hypothetical protein
MSEPAEDVEPETDEEVTAPAVPPYEKPVIRRYDQIDQVRPYGPTEV